MKLPLTASADSISLEELSPMLETYAAKLKNRTHTQQLVHFLSTELAAEFPRKALIESVLTTLANDNQIESELSIMIEQVWKHLGDLT